MPQAEHTGSNENSNPGNFSYNEIDSSQENIEGSQEDYDTIPLEKIAVNQSTGYAKLEFPLNKNNAKNERKIETLKQDNISPFFKILHVKGKHAIWITQRKRWLL